MITGGEGKATASRCKARSTGAGIRESRLIHIRIRGASISAFARQAAARPFLCPLGRLELQAVPRVAENPCGAHRLLPFQETEARANGGRGGGWNSAAVEVRADLAAAQGSAELNNDVGRGGTKSSPLSFPLRVCDDDGEKPRVWIDDPCVDGERSLILYRSITTRSRFRPSTRA